MQCGALKADTVRARAGRVRTVRVRRSRTGRGRGKADAAVEAWLGGWEGRERREQGGERDQNDGASG
eukprot:6182705-Pleurochrysis_carterae.AAC.3